MPSWAEPVWHLFVVRHSARARLQEALAQRSIGTMIHYPIPPHLQPAYAQLGWSRGCFPISERIASEVLSLPMGPHLDWDEREAVVAALVESLGT